MLFQGREEGPTAHEMKKAEEGGSVQGEKGQENERERQSKRDMKRENGKERGSER